MGLEGQIQIQAPILPTNDNPRMWGMLAKHVKGAPIIATSVADLVANYHPNRLVKGNFAFIDNYPTTGKSSEFKLVVEPSTMVDASGNSVMTSSNFSTFWELVSETGNTSLRVYQYSKDKTGGGMPVYPYTLVEEANWSNNYDASQGHKWMRFRVDDVDSNADGIFDNWTIPIPIGSVFATGDYIDKRYKRQDVSATVHTSSATLLADKYYIVEKGRVDIDGNLSLNDIGEYGTNTHIELAVGRVFKYVAGNTYTFVTYPVGVPASVTEFLKAPPMAINGLPNNEPVGYFDAPPVGTAQLWEISGQKSVYGQLKTEWIIRKIIENPNFVRYSNSPSPHPDTLVGTNTSASSGSGGDTALIAAGWVSVYNNQSFIATRQTSPGPNLYTSWLVEKINEESGEYKDRVFKLFDLNLDNSSPTLVAPTNRDATKQGWSDTPLQETDSQINYVSESVKFFNGELKTVWSKPVPYTGKDVFIDYINSDYGDSFKYSEGLAVTPSQLTLQADIYKGTKAIWESSALTITYTWKIIYNNGAVANISPTSSPADNFYLLGSAGTPDNPGYIRANQRVVVKPAAVTGQAVIRCTQAITLTGGGVISFEDEFTIVDVTDGLDAKSLTITADNDRIIYDSTGAVFVPASIVIRAYWSNLASPTLYWYHYSGGIWNAITSGVGGYTISGNVLSLAPSTVFASNSTAEEKKYAVSTHATNPTSANYDTTFSDFITIAKLSSAAVGTPGANSVSALLQNEAHTVLLDSSTTQPVAGEISSTGKAKTLLELYDGTTKKTYSTDYTIALASDNANITFDKLASGSDVLIYITAWGVGQRSAVCTITITYGARTVIKMFSLTSTLDAPGAIIVDIDSDKGYIFTPTDKANKTLTAKLYDTSKPAASQLISLPDALYTFRWFVANAWDVASTTNFTKTITNANILTSSKVTLEVYKSAALFRTLTVNLSDVNDGKTYRAWTDNATKPTDKLIAQNPTDGLWPKTVGTVVWRLPTDVHWASNVPTYAQDAEVSAGVYSWLPVYQLKGESGSQGLSGNFYHAMYIAKDSTISPAFGAGGNASTLAQMKAVTDGTGGTGWTSKAPATGVVWRTERLWTGQGVTFDVNNDPNTSPVSGSVWMDPVRIVSKDGLPGTNGSNGFNGWNPLFALVAGVNAGEKVLQLSSWVGGSGPPPGFTGYYVGAAGLTTVLANAQVITGEPIEITYDAITGYIKWKYLSESAGAYRNIYQVGNNEWEAPGGSGTWLSTGGRWVYVDTGDTTSKTLSFDGWMDALGDTVYRMTLEGNDSASYTGGTVLIQRDKRSWGIGNSWPTQHQIRFYGTYAYRYYILKIDITPGQAAGQTAYFGLKVKKIQ